MSNDSCISYNVGILKPGEEREFCLYVYMQKNNTGESSENIIKDIDKIKRFDVNKKIEETCKFWKKYVSEHINIDLNKFNDKINLIYKRSILLFPLFTNTETGGIIASAEIDEDKKMCGGYGYCWPRDAVFITKALDLLKMQDISDSFYLKFCKNTQSNNGMWEQRFFTNGNLAPCWGYQIDETASVIFGIYEHYKITENLDFLQKSVKMCENACEFLFKYVENVLDIEENDIVKKELQNYYNRSEKIEKHLSYDLWEMNEGVHLYSLSSIYSAFEAMLNIEDLLQNDDNKNSFNNRLKQENVVKLKNKLEDYKCKIKDYIIENLTDDKRTVFKRNLIDNKADISMLGVVYPFNVFSKEEKIVKNTVEMLNMKLRTFTGGYLRFEDDHYIGGKNPWVISSLWMALYYIKCGNVKEATDILNFITNTASSNGFLAEQVDNPTMQPAWIIALGWSHAMFVLLLNEI